MASRGVKIAYDFKKTSKLSPAQIDQANEIFEKHRVVNFVELSKLKEVLREIAMKKPGWEVNEKNLRDFISGLDKQFKQGKVLQPEFLQIYDQFLELTETEEWTPEKLDFLVPRLRDKSMGLEIKNRKSMFKSFEMVFKGHDMVEWLFDKRLSKTREEAIYVGGLLLKSGRILPIPPPSSASTVVEFKDDQSFWRFIEDDKELKEIEEKKKKAKGGKNTKVPGLGLDLIKTSRRKDDPLASARYIQFSRTSSEVPTAIQHLITFLNENALEVPGIFRVSGQHDDMIALKKLYDKGKYPLPELGKYDINTVAGVLKLWLRELPEPLLTFELYEPFIAATSITDSEEERLECIRKVLKRLPTGNFVLLNFLVKFLINVAAKSEITKMTPSNLAIVFTPTCLRPEKETIEIMFGHSTSANSLFETFIEKYAELFLPRDAHRKVAVKGEQAKYVFGTLRRAKKLLILQELEEQAALESEREATPSPKGEQPNGEATGEGATPLGTEGEGGRRHRSASVAEATNGSPREFVEPTSGSAIVSSPSSKDETIEKVTAAVAAKRHRRTPSVGKMPGHRRSASSSGPGTTSSAWLQFFQQPTAAEIGKEEEGKEGGSGSGSGTGTTSEPTLGTMGTGHLPPLLPVPIASQQPSPSHVSIQLTPRSSVVASPRAPNLVPPIPLLPLSASTPSASSSSSTTTSSSSSLPISPRSGIQPTSPRTIVYVSPRAQSSSTIVGDDEITRS